VRCAMRSTYVILLLYVALYRNGLDGQCSDATMRAVRQQELGSTGEALRWCSLDGF
jgi:hypothetical protein